MVDRARAWRLHAAGRSAEKTVTDQIAYVVFLTIVFGTLAVLSVSLVAIFIVLLKRNRYPRLVKRRRRDERTVHR